MKIVDYETFIRMPAGTIFVPWSPCIMLDQPEIKIDHGRETLVVSGGHLKKEWEHAYICDGIFVHIWNYLLKEKNND